MIYMFWLYDFSLKCIIKKYLSQYDPHSVASDHRRLYLPIEHLISIPDIKA